MPQNETHLQSILGKDERQENGKRTERVWACLACLEIALAGLVLVKHFQG